MLTDLDESLAALFDAGLPEDATVSLESGASGTVLEIVLVDVRECLNGQDSDWTDLRDERGRVVARVPPARRFALRYLLTASCETRTLEHRVLDSALRTVAAHRALPDWCLRGSLVGLGRAVLLAPFSDGDAPIDVAVAERFGVAGRSVLALTVTAPLVGEPVSELPAAVRHLRVTGRTL